MRSQKQNWGITTCGSRNDVIGRLVTEVTPKDLNKQLPLAGLRSEFQSTIEFVIGCADEPVRLDSREIIEHVFITIQSAHVIVIY
jgi:hypothetical protein